LRAEVAGRFVRQVFGRDQVIHNRGGMRLSSWRPSRRAEILSEDLNTGCVMITANSLHSLHIEDLNETESRDILGRLFAYMYGEFIMSHRWQIGDLAIWRNTIVQHGRPSLASLSTRSLRRLIAR
jgi:alpha-ketoglutarate-dependent taurine dioxygenase